MPWKLVSPCGKLCPICGLQFGHGCDAVETNFDLDESAYPRVLQFGHGCDAVETWVPTTAAFGRCALQFGHGCDAVETARPRPAAASGPSFNSATAVMPWKRVWPATRSTSRRPLQFGHGCDAVETRQPHAARPRRRPPSIRPRL